MIQSTSLDTVVHLDIVEPCLQALQEPRQAGSLLSFLKKTSSWSGQAYRQRQQVFELGLASLLPHYFSPLDSSPPTFDQAVATWITSQQIFFGLGQVGLHHLASVKLFFASASTCLQSHLKSVDRRKASFVFGLSRQSQLNTDEAL